MGKPKNDIVPGHADIDDFFYWINERHRIYVARFRDHQPKPWTEDEIFLDWKFTNVFRELDRGTLALRDMIHKWLKAGWGKKAKHPVAELILFNVIWYRLTNREEHSRDIGFVEDIHELVDRLRAKDRKGEPIFTSAHLTVGIAGEPKLVSYIRTFHRIWKERSAILALCKAGTLEAVWEGLMDYECIGRFIAYEIVSDLRHYGSLWPSEAPTDVLTWANVGPGCKRGLLRLGLPDDGDSLTWLWNLAHDSGTEPLVVDDMRYEWVTDKPCGLESKTIIHHPAWARFNDVPCMLPRFELREIEHSLCEFDKYQRVKTGAGRPRQTYDGRS